MIDTRAIAGCRTILLGGHVVLVPTDTVYGLAAALDVPAGVDALYRLKGRPRSQPCQVLLFGPRLLDEALAVQPASLAAAARALLPGTATCLLPDPEGRYAAASGGSPGAVGIRAPAMDPLFAAIDMPLVATSANAPGQADPRVPADVPAAIRAGVECVLDAGPLPGVASAIVDLRPVAAGAPAVLLRAGPDPAGVASRLAAAGVSLAT